MKILIAILSCERDRWAHDQARRTWLKDCLVEYKFLLGTACLSPKVDEIILPVPDVNGTLKIRSVVSQALSQGYVCVSRLLNSGFEQRDWTGRYGGSGYWLSRKAMLALQEGKDENTERPHDEDAWVPDNLIKFGFTPHIDTRYNSSTDLGPQVDNDIITSHLYARQEPYSGPIAPPPSLVFSKERLNNLVLKYHEKAKGL